MEEVRLRGVEAADKVAHREAQLESLLEMGDAAPDDLLAEAQGEVAKAKAAMATVVTEAMDVEGRLATAAVTAAEAAEARAAEAKASHHRKSLDKRSLFKGAIKAVARQEDEISDKYRKASSDCYMTVT